MATRKHKAPSGTVAKSKAEIWDANSEQQWFTDKAAGGAAWAQKFIALAKSKPEKYALEGWIDDAERLFEGNHGELNAFYETLQAAVVNEASATPEAPKAPVTPDLRKVVSILDRMEDDVGDLNDLFLAIDLTHDRLLNMLGRDNADILVLLGLARKRGEKLNRKTYRHMNAIEEALGIDAAAKQALLADQPAAQSDILGEVQEMVELFKADDQQRATGA